MNWNPLYLQDEDVSTLEDAIREAEWEDDMRQAIASTRESSDIDGLNDLV